MLENRRPNSRNSNKLKVLAIYGDTEITRDIKNSIGEGGRETSTDTINKRRRAPWELVVIATMTATTTVVALKL